MDTLSGLECLSAVAQLTDAFALEVGPLENNARLRGFHMISGAVFMKQFSRTLATRCARGFRRRELRDLECRVNEMKRVRSFLYAIIGI